jgi:hypothetical protein
MSRILRAISVGMFALAISLSSAWAAGSASRYRSPASNASVSTGRDFSSSRQAETWQYQPYVGALAEMAGTQFGVAYGVNKWLAVGPSFTHYSASTDGSQQYYFNSTTYASKGTGWAIGARADFYLNGDRARSGWIVSPYAKLLPKLRVEGNRDQVVNLTGEYPAQVYGLVMAYQFRLWEVATLNMGFGFAHWSGVPDSVDGTGNFTGVSIPTPDNLHGWVPSVDLRVGFLI